MSSAWRAGGGRLRLRRGSIGFVAARWGASIRDVGRVGKRVVVHLDSGDAIVLEPRMTGLVLVADPPSASICGFAARSRATASASFCIGTAAGWEVFACFRRKSSKRRSGRRKLGPDALAMTAELFRDAAWRQPAGGESGAAGSAGRGGHRQSVCVRDSAPGRHPSGHALRQAHARPMAARLPTRRMRCSKRRSATKARRSATARTATRSTRKAAIRIITACTTERAKPARAAAAGSRSRAHRSGAAVDVLLPGCQRKRSRQCGAAMARDLYGRSSRICGTLHSRRGFALMMGVPAAFEFIRLG